MNKFEIAAMVAESHGAKETASFIREAARERAGMLATLKGEQYEISQLCDTVNHLSGRLKLGRKVNPADWGERGRAVIASAEKGEKPPAYPLRDAAPAMLAALNVAADALALLAAHAAPLPPYKAEKYRAAQDAIRTAISKAEGQS